MGDAYREFLASKFATIKSDGIDTDDIASHLFPHQRDLVAWALRRGRAAIFADTGLGKTAMQIEWARHVSQRGRVLILAPLSVGPQTAREAARFGVYAPFRREDDGSKIIIMNYEMLHKIDPSQFIGVVLDESSILKSFTGATRNAILAAFANTRYKLACTATPSPNDYTELGNHSEFLGIKSRVEMLAEYFTHDMENTQDWRLKGHAKVDFWRWVSLWGAVVRLPSDLGYDDGDFALPPIKMTEHVVPVSHADLRQVGALFASATTLSEQRASRRHTISARVDVAASLVDNKHHAVVWCELNDEGDALTAAIDGAVQVRGSDSADRKEAALSGFAAGGIRVMVSKPSIAGYGLNWQHCSNVIFVGASHSYEQTYQAIRRCWRFGQKNTVNVHIIRSETEAAVSENYKRKERDAEAMYKELSALARGSVSTRSKATREWNDYKPNTKMEVPSWLTSEI